MGKRILIVDDDPWILRMVSTVMEGRGHLVATAQEGQEGLDQALDFRPDLVISDVLMPGMNGWSFIRALRSHPELSLIPVIFLTGLTSDEDRILGFRLGADDYLAKPFRFEELDLRVEKALRTGELIRQRVTKMVRGGPGTGAGEAPRGGAPDTAIGFAGDLTQLGVSSLLTILEIERKSGILVLRGEQTGRIFLRDGHIVAAAFDGKCEPRGAEVVYEMLAWKSGRFEFSALEVEMDDQINSSTSHLLLEGARRLDEANAGNER